VTARCGVVAIAAARAGKQGGRGASTGPAMHGKRIGASACRARPRTFAHHTRNGSASQPWPAATSGAASSAAATDASCARWYSPSRGSASATASLTPRSAPSAAASVSAWRTRGSAPSAAAPRQAARPRAAWARSSTAASGSGAAGAALPPPPRGAAVPGGQRASAGAKHADAATACWPCACRARPASTATRAHASAGRRGGA
jgi:hypothetical protein